MELVQHEVVHSRQASVLTFKCIGFKRWTVNSIPLWLWSANVFATKMLTTYVHIEVNSWTWGSWGSPEMVLDFYSWVYATDLFRDLQYHPTSMGWGSRSLCWLIPFSWSLHRIGCPDIRTQILLRARDRIFPPRLMTLMITWTNDCHLPAPTPTSPLKHTPRAVA